MKSVNPILTAGSSFWGSTINASIGKLIKVCGEPNHKSGDSKVKYVWTLENNKGVVFSIYDWKEYREIGQEESITWNIGGFNLEDTNMVKMELEKSLNSIT
jgi:hypothetical protein